jgi:Fic family protein
MQQTNTEQLFTRAVEEPGHPHAEAVMILDHKRAIDHV